MSLADSAYELIKNDIIICILKPSQQIVQSQLAELYGLGVTPIREALQRLSMEGYVSSVPRYGYVVTPITIADVKELYELRGVLEASAARLAVERGSDSALEEIREKSRFVYHYKDRASYVEFLKQNRVFHRSIALLSGNERLVEMIDRVVDEMTRIFHLGLDLKDSAEEMRDEHIELAEALYNRDADAAEIEVRRQIERSQQRVLLALMETLNISKDLEHFIFNKTGGSII